MTTKLINIYRLACYLLSITSLIYAAFKTYALANIYQSPLWAIWHNGPLLALAVFFVLFTVLLARRYSLPATFATGGAVLTAIVI